MDSEWLSSEAYDAGIYSVIGRKLQDNEKQFLMGKPFSALTELFPTHDINEIVDNTLAYYKEHNHKIKPYEGIPDLLETLHGSGYKLGIVTTKLKVNAEAELLHTGIRSYFDVVLTREDTKESKPSPAPLLQAAGLLSVSPQECMYVGDQPTDIEATRAAHMISVAALWGEGQPHRLLPLSPANFSNHPHELLGLLQEPIIRFPN